MPDFFYRAADPGGGILKGLRSAKSAAELADRLKKTGLLLIECRVTRARSILTVLNSIRPGGVSRRELIEFSGNMGVMIRSGVQVMKALDEIRQDSASPYFRGALSRVISAIEEGDCLHEAMGKIPGIFPHAYINVIEVGENTGRLDTVFLDLARHLKRIDNLIRETRNAMIYPAFLLATMAAVIMVWLTWVFPSLLDMLKNINVNLPPFTRVVISLFESVKSHWPLIFSSLACLVFLVCLSRKNRTARYCYDWCELNIPGVKNLFLQFRLTFFMRYLAMLLNAGVDILRGMELGTGSVNNMILQKRLFICRQEITEGSLLSETLKRSGIIPNMVIRMVAVGEKSGNLAGQMDMVADQYNDELTQRINTVIALIGPLLVIPMVMLGFGVVISVYLPLYDLLPQILSQIGAG